MKRSLAPLRALAPSLALVVVLGPHAAAAQNAAPSACLDPAWASDSGLHSARVEASGTELTFCLSRPYDPAVPPRCYRVDLTRGAFTALPTSAQSAAAPAPPPAAPDARVEQGALRVCTAPGACRTIALPGTPRLATVNARRTRALVTALRGGALFAQWVSLPSGALGASFRVRAQEPRAARVELLGDTPVLYDCVEAGPGCTGYLLRSDGRRLTPVGDRENGFNLYGSDPLLLREDLFAVAQSDGSSVALQDPQTGRIVAQVSTPSADSPELGAALLRAGPNLALVTGGAAPGQVSLLDAATLATRGRWALPVCSAAPAAPR